MRVQQQGPQRGLHLHHDVQRVLGEAPLGVLREPSVHDLGSAGQRSVWRWCVYVCKCNCAKCVCVCVKCVKSVSE